ncbi:hypothetical protein LV779_36085 [Streptomyces thinghirensis]|nr:hypothetical protein [Streptomyces thinghirensis]
MSKCPLRKVAVLVGGLHPEPDPPGQLGVGVDMTPQLLHDDRGEVRAPVLLALGRQSGQQQTGADTDLQDAAGLGRPDPLERGRTPLPHVGQRDRLAVVTAVPAGEVLAQRRAEALSTAES